MKIIDCDKLTDHQKDIIISFMIGGKGLDKSDPDFKLGQQIFVTYKDVMRNIEQLSDKLREEEFDRHLDILFKSSVSLKDLLSKYDNVFVEQCILCFDLNESVTNKNLNLVFDDWETMDNTEAWEDIYKYYDFWWYKKTMYNNILKKIKS